MSKKLAIDITWYPQPRQAELLNACGLLDVVLGNGPDKPPIADVIGYGGAAYGGKTDGDLGVAIAAAFAYPGCKIAFFRRTYPELVGIGGALPRSLEILSGITRFNGDDHIHTFPSGSLLQFLHCQYESDVYRYKSLQFDILIVDEATTFTWFIIDYLLTRNRATIQGVQPFALMTTNPGDIGHSWYMQVFDTMNHRGPHRIIKQTENPNGKQQGIYFIPAFIQDNEIGLKRDPGYEARLMQRDPVLARALCKGDWSIFAGQAFPTWRYDQHVKPYQELPETWACWRSLDYGWDHPFACYWWKRDPELTRLFVFREVTGRHLTDREQARVVRDSTIEKVHFTFASPDMWKGKNFNDVVTTSVDEYKAEGVFLTKADNDRIGGKRKFDRVLANLPDGEPGIIIFDTCPELIKCIPALVKSRSHHEDVEKVDGDDPYDAARYGLTHIQPLQLSHTEQVRKQEKSPLMAYTDIL
jgi:hypothetical protein